MQASTALIYLFSVLQALSVYFLAALYDGLCRPERDDDDPAARKALLKDSKASGAKKSLD